MPRNMSFMITKERALEILKENIYDVFADEDDGPVNI